MTSKFRIFAPDVPTTQDNGKTALPTPLDTPFVPSGPDPITPRAPAPQTNPFAAMAAASAARAAAIAANTRLTGGDFAAPRTATVDPRAGEADTAAQMQALADAVQRQAALGANTTAAGLGAVADSASLPQLGGEFEFADIISEAQRENPFRGNPSNEFREPYANYDPTGGFDTSGLRMPTNLEEAAIARAWLQTNAITLFKDPSELGSGQLLVQTGARDADERFTVKPATAEQLRQFQFQAELLAEINNITQRAYDFDTAAIEEAQIRARDAGQKELDAEFAQFMAELEKDRALDPELFEQRKRELTTIHENAIDELETAALEARATEVEKQRLQVLTMERQFDLDVAIQQSQQDFAAAQNALDRDLQALELGEAQRQAQVLETLDRNRLRLEQQQFKMGIFSFLTSSPEMIFFMNQSPDMKAQFDTLLDETDENVGLRTAVDDVIARINEQPTTNIQKFMQLTGTEQGLERFRTSALTGIPQENVERALAGQAPAARGLPAAGSGLQRIRLGR